MKIKWQVQFKFRKADTYNRSVWYEKISDVENFIGYLLQNILFNFGENLHIQIIEKEVKKT